MPLFTELPRAKVFSETELPVYGVLRNPKVRRQVYQNRPILVHLQIRECRVAIPDTVRPLYGKGEPLGLDSLRRGEVPELLHHAHRIIVVPALHYLTFGQPFDSNACHLYLVTSGGT